MKKRLTLKEAGSFSNLTSKEKEQLSSAPPEIRSSVATALSSLRKKGKNVDLLTIVQQMREIPHFKSDPNLSKFQTELMFGGNVFSKGKGLKPPMPGIKPPPESIMNFALPPKTSGPTPGDKFEQMRTNKDVSNDDVLAQQRQQQQSSFEKAKQLRAQRDARQGKVNPFAQTQRVAEAFNPASMMTGALKNIFGTISKMKPEELMAIAQLVNSLMNKDGGGGNTVGATMENKSMIAKAVKNKLLEQIEARNTAQKLLSEGPMANVWDKIKGAGSAVKQGLKGQMAQQTQAIGADENSKKAAQEITKLLGKVNQHRQKFNSSILKNSEAMNSYHDLVLSVVQSYQQNQNVLGPFGQQLVRQVQDAVGNLSYDLKSEKEQIDAFLNQIKDAGISKVGTGGSQATLDPTLLGAKAKKQAEEKRAQENPGSKVSSARRGLPMGGGKIDPKYGDDLERSQAFEKAKAASMSGDAKGTQQAMNDLQKLFMKQIEREKKSGKK